MNLYMLLVGATPPGRHTEQHDVYFGVGEKIRDTIPGLIAFWPEAKNKLHLDAWRKVQSVDGHKISIRPGTSPQNGPRLFFLNLGGYKPDEFEEFHYKMIVVANDKGTAIARAKQTAFYRHTGFQGATSHIDDKYGVDVDDIYEIADILPANALAGHHIHIEPGVSEPADAIHLGYFRLDSVEKWETLETP